MKSRKTGPRRRCRVNSVPITYDYRNHQGGTHGQTFKIQKGAEDTENEIKYVIEIEFICSNVNQNMNIIKDEIEVGNDNVVNVVTAVQIQCLKCEAIFNNKFKYILHSKSCFYLCPYFGCTKKFKIDYKFDAHRRSHLKMLRRLI